MNFVGTCEECRRISAAYEAATMDWFRVQGQLRVAEYSREEEASSRIIAELSAITARRQALREEAEKHDIEAHPRAAAASGDFPTP
jgi:hypothetical protein